MLIKDTYTREIFEKYNCLDLVKTLDIDFIDVKHLKAYYNKLSIVISHSKSYLGQCSYYPDDDRYVISLHERLFNYGNDLHLRNTFIHELCHVFIHEQYKSFKVNNRVHGEDWRKLMYKYGELPFTTHSEHANKALGNLF